jgi:hypothetical protein
MARRERGIIATVQLASDDVVDDAAAQCWAEIAIAEILKSCSVTSPAGCSAPRETRRHRDVQLEPHPRAALEARDERTAAVARVHVQPVADGESKKARDRSARRARLRVKKDGARRARKRGQRS